MHPVEMESARQAILVRSVVDLNAMVSALLDRERETPIIGLTTRRGEMRPSIPAADVRRIVGPDVPVYFIAGRTLGYKLKEILAPDLYVYGGASRVWWPGLNRKSNTYDHPLIVDVGPETVMLLAAAIAHPPRASPLTRKDRRLRRAEQRADQLAQHLRKVKRERDDANRARERAVLRATSAERALERFDQEPYRQRVSTRAI
jgi:hypothetical protein